MTDVSPSLVQDVRAASRQLVREFGFLDKTIAGTDLSGSGVHAILEIGLNPGVTAKELAGRLKLEKSTISRLLKSLEVRGEIIQTRSEHDGRVFGLSLTHAGWKTYDKIDTYGDDQARGALSRIRNGSARSVADALTTYADALSETSEDVTANQGQYEIVEGYQTGMIGDIAALHARTHGAIIGMGPTFESVVSRAMAEFMPRIDNSMNNSWSIVEKGEVIGSITIDGEDLDGSVAHLRWFILSEKLRGLGLGRTLLSRAISHCDTLGFDEIHLWTLKGLDAARSLYEKSGFELANEYVGDQWGKTVTEQMFIRKRS
ncbi:helix-turn-helix domain-containing GNAT family N-acetyltransferase [Roseibium sp. HPY-6]|uniref:helix-turn-helix domain-containing GNAT family N-acetyltransferase n=1 Tax=Roseibium sp. HPY-6 TaxID=3229852 RepID=UPI00338EF391